MAELDLQTLLQQLAALAAVALAAGWLTVRWMLRRRRAGCGGDCGRCAARGGGPSPCASPSKGLRPEGLRVLQGPGNVSPPGAV